MKLANQILHITALVVVCGFFHCKSSQPVSSDFTPDYKSGPQLLVYKTKKDYSQNVFVMLSQDKSEIVSYPNPSDCSPQNRPEALKNGFWIDKKGIGPNAAFLSFTYEQYAALSAAPSLQELNKAIIDRDPFVEMYNCGNRYSFKDPVAELNVVIESGGLSRCKKLK